MGGGPDREGLERQARESNLKDVEFLGQIPRPKTLGMIQGARFLVFPSEWYEGFPVTICEAFACGTPVICSRLGAMEEVVADGDTGFHFEPGDAGQLAGKALWAWTHPEEMRQMGRRARREFEAKYTAESNYPLLMSILWRASWLLLQREPECKRSNTRFEVEKMTAEIAHSWCATILLNRA